MLSARDYAKVFSQVAVAPPVRVRKIRFTRMLITKSQNLIELNSGTHSKKVGPSISMRISSGMLVNR